MNPLRVELYAERYQRQLDSLLQHDLDVITNERNRQFVADTIREVGVTESIRKRFGLESYDTSLADDQLASAIVGTESNVGADLIEGLWTDIVKYFASGYRWMQALTDTSASKIVKINQLMDMIAKNSSKLKNKKIEAYDLRDALHQYHTVNTCSIRDTTCKYLSEIGVTHGKDLLKRTADVKEWRSKTDAIDEYVSAAEKVSMDATAAFIQAKAVVAPLIKALRNIVTVNNKYQGFWRTGASVGKMDVIMKAVAIHFAHPIAGILISDYFKFPYRNLAARSWQTISSACSLDTDLCNKLLKNLKQLADAAK